MPFFLKQMVLVTVEESTWGMTCAFGLIYSCVLGWFFPNHCLAIQLISTFLCLGVLAVELDSAILSQNAGMLGLFSDILEPQVRMSPFSDILHPFCSIFSKL